nr:terminase TerL endonuclease subunit [uncultured Aminipila sp.]
MIVSYLKDYHTKCKWGDIIIGQELMTELDFLIADIDSGEYIFNTTEAHKRIKFIETKCKHFEAPYAGKPFILELFQKAFIEAIFSFYMFDEDEQEVVRRFQEVLYLVGRKNGKTPLIGAICLSEWFCGETGKKIMCASNDYDQADLMFQAINSMREESKTLERVTRKNIKGIFFGNPKQKKKKGKFSYQNKGSIKKLSAKSGAKEGRNLGVGAVDEVFEMKDDTTVMPIKQALSTQKEPLYFELTTEGFTNDGYLDKRLIEARQVLRGEIVRKRWLIWLYTQDSEEEVWQDETSWNKSNPGLGTIKKKSFLRRMLEESKGNPSRRAFVLAKDFNIKQNAAIAWLTPDEILNEETFDLEDFKNGYYIAGSDFAETTDLCASTILLYKDKTKFNHTMYWITKNKLEHNDDGIDYYDMAKKGHVRIVESTNIDTSIVADYQWELYTKYGLKPYKSGYDRRFATAYKNKFKDYFGDDILMDILQTAPILHNPMKTVENDLRNKKHNYNNNPVTMYCLKNTGFKLDSKGFMQPTKISSNRRIDGAASTVTAQATYNSVAAEFERL